MLTEIIPTEVPDPMPAMGHVLNRHLTPTIASDWDRPEAA